MESSAVTLQPPLDGLLVNTGPFVLQEALFKNDLDLIFGDSRLFEYNATIFDHLLPILLVFLPSAKIIMYLLDPHSHAGVLSQSADAKNSPPLYNTIIFRY